MRKHILITTLVFFSVIFQTQAQEICNNNIDDDGDGLVDCADCLDCASSANCVLDTDNDGIGDYCDNDDDNDGITDDNENQCGFFDDLNPSPAINPHGPATTSTLTTKKGQTFIWTSSSTHEIGGSINYRSCGSVPSSTATVFDVTVTFPTPTTTFEIFAFDYDGPSKEGIEDFNILPTSLSSNAVLTIDPITGYSKVTSTSQNQNITVTWDLPSPTSTLTFKVTRPSCQWGIQFLVGFPYCDTDNDGIIDSKDPDSDGDGCFDVVESGGIDANNDGYLDGTGLDGNGLITGGTGGYNGVNGNEYNGIGIATTPLVNQNITMGTSASFSLSATGNSATEYNAGTPVYGSPGNSNAGLNYQWYIGDPNSGGTPISNSGIYTGATTSTLNISNITGLNGTTYYVQVTHNDNVCLEVIESATLSFNPCDATQFGLPDADGDNVADSCDEDDDNDGILDRVECGTQIINGSFETPILSTPYLLNVGTINGWTTVSGSFDLHSPTINNASDGNQSIDLQTSAGDPPGVIQKTFKVGQIGQPFSFTIDYAGATSSASADAIVDGVVVSNLVDLTPAPNLNEPLNLSWETYSYNGISTDTVITIRFASTGTATNFWGLFLDNFNFETICPDNDNDGLTNDLDKDADGDGCFDVVESGGIDANNDGVLDGTGFDNNGRVIGGIGGYDGITDNEYEAHQLTITDFPIDQVGTVGQSTIFSVTAQANAATSYTNGTPVYGTLGNANSGLLYQWYLGDPNAGGTMLSDGGVYTGTSANMLGISDVTGLAFNQYYVVVRHSNNPCLEEIRSATLYTTEICGDGIDNDNDGLIDCDDCADCSSDSGCAGLGADHDNDGISDLCDEDDDNDGILDADEGCIECNGDAFINGDFELNGLNSGNSFAVLNEGTVDGWSTTSTDHNIEIWRDGFSNGSGGPVPAQSGTFFAEINATQNAALYQRICTRPGAQISWSVWHRGRGGVDMAVVKIGDDFATAPIQTTMTTGNTAWVQYSGVYTVPDNQIFTYFIFEAVSTALGIAAGNFVDNIVIQEIVPGICLDTDNDGMPNSKDLDADGDGCLDVVESGGIDADNDGVLDGTGFDNGGLVTGGTGGYNGVNGSENTASRVTINTAAPFDRTVLAGDAVDFGVAVTADNATSYNNGTPVYGAVGNANAGLQYQWYLGDPNSGGMALSDNTIFNGTNTATLTINNTEGYHAYDVCVVVSHVNNNCIQELRCATLSLTENCSNGIDDDGDGLVDCDDPDCKPAMPGAINRN